MSKLVRVALLIVLCSPSIFGQSGGATEAILKRIESQSVGSAQVGLMAEMVAKRGDTKDLERLFRSVLKSDKLDSAAKTRTVKALRDAAVQRGLLVSIPSDAFSEFIGEAAKQGDEPLQQELLALAAAWQLSGIEKILSESVTASSSKPIRQSALAALASLGTDESKSRLAELSSQVTDVDTLIATYVAWIAADADNAATKLSAVVERPDITSDHIQLICNAFFARQDASGRLQQAIQTTPLSKDVASLFVRSMIATGRSEDSLVPILRGQAGMGEEEKPLTGAQKAHLVHLVESEGDATRGELVFRRTELSCFKCHAISGAGGNIGPELSALGANSPIEYLIDSIVAPDQAIKEAYVTRKILTTDGLVAIGIQVDRDDQRVVLKDANGKQITIATADIEDESEGPSLMPKGLKSLMTEREFVDLVKYLYELGRPGPYVVRSKPTVQRWLTLNDAAIAKSTDNDIAMPIPDAFAKWPSDVWTSFYALTAGKVPSSELKKNALARSIILRADIQVVVAGEVGFRVTPAFKIQGRFGGKGIDPTKEPVVTLPAGTHSLYLRVYSDQLPDDGFVGEFFRPDGSKADFTVVGGQ